MGQLAEAKLEARAEPILFSLRPLPRHAHQGQPTSSQHLKRLCDKFCNHSKFLALHQIFEKKTSEKERMKEENQKKNRKHNEQAPPLYKIALGHAPSQKTITRELLWLARASAKI